VVGIDRDSQQAEVFDLGQRGTVDTTRFDITYVVILNQETHDDIYACTATDWELNVSAGAGNPQTQANGEVFSTVHFITAG
jgi:hypothetical protein